MTNEQLHPQSYRELRALVAMHGIELIRKVLDEIALEHAVNRGLVSEVETQVTIEETN